MTGLLPQAEALNTRSVSRGHQLSVALAARPALTLPSKTSLDTDAVPPLGPFPVIDPQEIIQQSKASMCLRVSGMVKSVTQQECLACLSLKDGTTGNLRLSNGTEIRKPARGLMMAQEEMM